MKYKNIVTDPKICHGTPVFKGTRIPIYVILEFLSAGENIENILLNYPQIKDKHVREALML